jgi:hypothetical protein
MLGMNLSFKTVLWDVELIPTVHEKHQNISGMQCVSSSLLLMGPAHLADLTFLGPHKLK